MYSPRRCQRAWEDCVKYAAFLAQTFGSSSPRLCRGPASTLWHHGGVSDTAPRDIDSVVRFRSNGERVAFMIVGVAAGAVFGFIAVTDDPLFGLFLLLCPVVFLEGLRAEIVVDLGQGTISSQRAIRRWTGRIEDIENIRVPPWGPIALMLRPGIAKAGGGLWPGQILTGVYADQRGSAGRALQLADVLGLEVTSVWPQVRRGYEYSEDDPLRGVRTDLFKSRSGILIWIAIAAALSIIAVILVATIKGS